MFFLTISKNKSEKHFFQSTKYMFNFHSDQEKMNQLVKLQIHQMKTKKVGKK